MLSMLCRSRLRPSMSVHSRAAVTGRSSDSQPRCQSHGGPHGARRACHACGGLHGLVRQGPVESWVTVGSALCGFVCCPALE